MAILLENIDLASRTRSMAAPVGQIKINLRLCRRSFFDVGGAMRDGAWVSLAPGSSATIVRVETDILDERKSDALAYIRKNNQGEALPQQCFPRRINIDPNVDHPDQLDEVRHLFQAGYWFVSEKCATVLREFDLGRGALYPVTVLQADKRTPVYGAYFSLNFGAVKETFIPQTSNALGELPGLEAYRQLYPIARDGDVTLSNDALSGPDMWIERYLILGFFVSNWLAAALQAAGCDAPFKLRRCRIL